jgi:hypothetical protein
MVNNWVNKEADEQAMAPLLWPMRKVSVWEKEALKRART